MNRSSSERDCRKNTNCCQKYLNEWFSGSDFSVEVLLFLGGLFGLALSRHNTAYILIFFIFYFILVYRTYLRQSLSGLALCSMQSALILAFRFKYLTWGDPWFEYAMILRIMETGMLSPEYYQDQQPALHTLIAAASTYMHLEAMPLQKFLIPSLSAAGVLSLYLISKDFVERDIAIASCLLLSVGTAYVHWISQAVTESLGIPLALIALYLSYRAISDNRYLPAAAIVIISLALTHHLTAVIFIVWLNSFLFAYLLFISENSKDALRALALSIFALAIPLTWWSMRLPNIYRLVINTIDKLVPAGDPVIAIVFVLISVYAIFGILNNHLIRLRSFLKRFQNSSKFIYYGLVVGGTIAAAIAMNFFIGRSFFVLKYPLHFYANGLLMLILFFIGLRGFINIKRSPFLAWAGGIGLLFLGSILKLYYFEDPLRFIEFLYPPLAVIGAYGYGSLVRKTDPKTSSAGLALICVFSLLVSFPPSVFLGSEFSQSDIIHDDRSYVIYHPESEMMALTYLKENGAIGKLHTDRYMGYASLQLTNLTSDLLIDLLEGKSSSGREKLDPDTFSGGNDFVLIRQRMMRYAEFGEWLLKEKNPLKQEEIGKLEDKTSRIYDNGEAWIYKG